MERRAAKRLRCDRFFEFVGRLAQNQNVPQTCLWIWIGGSHYVWYVPTSAPPASARTRTRTGIEPKDKVAAITATQTGPVSHWG